MTNDARYAQLEGAPRLRSRSLRVTPDQETMEELQRLFGAGNVRLVRTYAPPAPEPPPFWAQ